MGFNILDKDNNHIGWTLSKYDDANVTFIDDSKPLPATDVAALKINKISAIKLDAAQMITDTDWRLQRATEREQIGVAIKNIETVADVLSEREAIRAASNRAEMEINRLRSAKSINNFTWQVEPSDYPPTAALTHLQFLRRFTSDERAAINTAAKENASVNDYMSMLQMAKFISTKDADVILGVNMLEQNKIIGKGRAGQILVGL